MVPKRKKIHVWGWSCNADLKTYNILLSVTQRFLGFFATHPDGQPLDTLIDEFAVPFWCLIIITFDLHLKRAVFKFRCNLRGSLPIPPIYYTPTTQGMLNSLSDLAWQNPSLNCAQVSHIRQWLALNNYKSFPFTRIIGSYSYSHFAVSCFERTHFFARNRCT